MNTRNAVSLGTVYIYIYIDNTTRKKCSLFNHGKKWIFVQQPDTHTLCLQDYRIKAIANFACPKRETSLQTRKLHKKYREKIKRHEYNAQKTVF